MSYVVNAFVALLQFFGGIVRPLRFRRKVVKDKRRLLKIKLKSLACESRAIRFEELAVPKRYRNDGLREEMYHHRVVDVREEARATLLAYNYIRGKTYQQTEKGNHSFEEGQSGWTERLRKAMIMVLKYGAENKDVAPAELQARLAEWVLVHEEVEQKAA